MADDNGSDERLLRLLAQGTLETEAPIRHRDGHIVWVAISVNAVTSPSAGGHRGHLRRHHSRHHRHAGRGRTGARRRPPRHRGQRGEERRRGAVDHARRVPHDAGRADASRPSCGRRATRSDRPPGRNCCRHRQWHDLDPPLRRSLEDARAWLPLTVEPVGGQPKPTPHTASSPRCRGTPRCGSNSVNLAGSARRTGSSSPPLSDTSAWRCSMSASSSSPVTRR